jgi:hypothetical protein
MSIALLLTIVGVGLSSLLAATVTGQMRNTRFDVQRTHALNAAQSGIDVAVSAIRSTTKPDNSGNGDASLLPCGPISGTVSDGRAASYTVSIYYLAARPPAGDVAWARSQPPISCSPGLGPATLPRYALLESTGYARAGTPGRTVVATYTLSTSMSNPKIVGGLIHAHRTSGPDMCMSAGADQLVGGEYLYVMLCDTTSRRQKFAYQPNLNLKLVGSETSAAPGGMCLDAGTPHVANAPVRFRPCEASTIPRQQWGQNDYSAFQGTSDGVSLDRFCFNIVSPGTSGSRVVLGDSATDPAACYVAWDSRKTFFPDSTVGSGRAGPAQKQLVNDNQFGKCIDMTADDVTWPYLVIFPCKQQLTGTVQWNQAWNTPVIPAGATSATGPIYTNNTTDGYTYCLRSPGTTTRGYYPTLTRCTPATVTSSTMLWTVRGDTGFFSTSYRIESTYGTTANNPFCLTATDPDAPDPDLWVTDGFGSFSKLALATCTDSTPQKWNVASVITGSTLEDAVER